MQTRYSTALGFLAAASLLGGSAFAFAPTFVGDLPTVIITDKVSGAVLPNVYDPSNATTQFLFRYQDAFDLSSASYVNPGSSATINDVRFLFNEFADIDKDGVPDSINPELPTNRTILIQDATGGDNVSFATSGNPLPLSATEFASAPQVGFLDFRNIDFSPAADYADTTGIPFDAVGNSVPVHTIGSDSPETASGSQFRVVQVYINTSFSTQSPSTKSFLVVTSVDGDDRLTTGVPGGPSGPIPDFPAPQSPTTDFAGWQLQGLGLLALLPASGSTYGTLGTSAGNFTGFTTTPAVAFPTANPGNGVFGINNDGGITPVGTTSLTMNAATNAIGYIRFTKNVATSITANRLLRFRLRLESADSSVTSKDDFKFGMGTLKTGITNEFFASQFARGFDNLYTTPLTVGPESKFYNPPASPGADFDSYLFAEAADAGNAFNVFLDLQPTDATTAPGSGNDIKATSWQLDSFDTGANRSLLAGKNVLVNRGNTTLGTSPTLDPSEVITPESGATTFTFPGTAVGQTTGVGATAGNSSLASAVTMGGTGTALTYNQTTTGVPDTNALYPNLNSFSFFSTTPELNIDSPTSSLYRATNGKLYVFDVWASSTTPASNTIPQMRFTSVFGYVDLNITSHFLPSFLTLNTGAAITSAPKAYSGVNYCQVGPAFTSVTGLFTVDFLLPSASANTSAAANVTIHRITITEYTAP